MTKQITKKIERNLRSFVFSEVDKILTCEYGKRYIAYRKRWREVEKGEYLPNFPIHLDLDLTDKCNLKCKMCIRQTSPNIKLGEGISEKLMLSIIDEASKGGCCSLLIGNNSETLLEKNKFLSIADYALSKGICDIWLGTNGILLSEDVSREIIKMKISRLKVSIDAATRETYRTIRGADKFDKIVENIETFLSLRKSLGKSLPILRVSFVELDENRYEKEMFLDMWRNKADIISYQDVIDTNFDLNNLTPEQLNKIKKSKFYCFDPFRRLTILYDGTVRACCCIGSYYSERFNLGNIKNNPIKYFWDSHQIKMIRNKIKEGKFYELEECLRCKATIYYPSCLVGDK